MTVRDKIFYNLQGCYRGGTKKDYSHLYSIIKEQKIDIIFINFTAFGNLTHRIHKDFPYIEICSLAHNVEFMYVANICRIKKWRALFNLCSLFFVYLNERKQLRFTDQFLCLNQRDADLFERCYHRRPDMQIPLIIEDQYERVQKENSGALASSQSYGLFVGSFFKPNEFAARFLAEKIAPFLPIPIKIVGFGFEQIKDELEQYSNVEVVGTVDSLGEYYEHAAFVISPIFHGSGMKTKTAEALMFGKYFFGTKEAFIGYNLPLPECGLLCETAEDFISGIKVFLSHSPPKFYLKSRNIFLRRYSFPVLQKLLSQTFVALRK